jgi:hypothetical protein
VNKQQIATADEGFKAFLDPPQKGIFEIAFRMMF